MHGDRRNFRLPRELRDYLYKYLLDAEEVITAPYSSPAGWSLHPQAWNREHNSLAHTYHFHTNILAVNKEIHAEATDYLHANNLFIPITHRWRDLESIKHDFDVPIVTENARHIKRSTAVGLDCLIKHPDARATLAVHRPPLQGFLMLARDFPRFTCMMRWLFFQIDVATTLVIRRDEDRRLVYLQTAGRTGISVDVSMTPIPRGCENLKWLDSEMARLIILVSQLGIPGRSYTYHDSGENGSENIVKHTLDQINASTRGRMRHVRVEALLWSTIEVVQSLKKSADELVSQGRYNVAAERFTAICRAVTDWQWMLHLPFVLSNDVPRSAFRILFQLILDCRIMASRLYFRLGDATNGSTHSASVGILVNMVNGALPDSSPLWPNNFMEAFTSSAPTDLMITTLVMYKMEGFLRTAQNMFDVFQAGEPSTARTAADAAFFDSILNDGLALNLFENVTTRKEILGKMSIGTEAVQVLETPIPDAVLAQKPTNLLGWWILDEEKGSG